MFDMASDEMFNIRISNKITFNMKSDEFEFENLFLLFNFIEFEICRV